MLITGTRPNSSPVRIYINPLAKTGVEETEYITCDGSVVRAGKGEYNTTLAITGDTLHIWTNAEYYFYVCEYKKRPDISDYNALKAAEEWIATGRGFFSLGAMDVYIDQIDRTLEIYVDRGYTAKMECGGVALQVLGALSG